jgi:toxin ParE1/3/4
VTVDLGAAAVAEIDAACEHYREVRPGLEARFVEALDRLFGRLDAFPRSAPVVKGYEQVRRAPLRTFPYGVFYVFTAPDRIDVLRVIHTARSHAEWPPGGPQ